MEVEPAEKPAIQVIGIGCGEEEYDSQKVRQVFIHAFDAVHQAFIPLEEDKKELIFNQSKIIHQLGEHPFIIKSFGVHRSEDYTQFHGTKVDPAVIE